MNYYQAYFELFDYYGAEEEQVYDEHTLLRESSWKMWHEASESIRPPSECVVSSSLVDLGSLKICVTLWLRSSLVLRERIVSIVRLRGERRHLRWTLHSHRQRIRCASWSWIGSLYSLFQRCYKQKHFFFPNKTYKGLCISWVVVLGNELVALDP